MSCDADTVLEAAKANKYVGADPGQLDVILAQLTCDLKTAIESGGGGGGSGTVTSVGLTMPTGFSVSGSPVTTSGVLTVTTTLDGVITGNGSGFVAVASVPATQGGTGQTTTTTGDILVGGAANTWNKLAGVATGNALISGGVGTAPAWGKIGLTTHVSGTLAVGNGGTGATTFTANRLLIGAGAGAITTSANLTFAANRLTTTAITVDNGAGVTITLDGNGLEVLGAQGFNVSASTGNVSVGGFLELLNGDLSVTGSGLFTSNLQVDGKITANGGVDPPYVLFDAHTREETKARVLKEVPTAKQSGAAVFWNRSARRLEIYIAGEDKFFDLFGVLVDNALAVPV